MNYNTKNKLELDSQLNSNRLKNYNIKESRKYNRKMLYILQHVRPLRCKKCKQNHFFRICSFTTTTPSSDVQNGRIEQKRRNHCNHSQRDKCVPSPKSENRKQPEVDLVDRCLVKSCAQQII